MEPELAATGRELIVSQEAAGYLNPDPNPHHRAGLWKPRLPVLPSDHREGLRIVAVSGITVATTSAVVKN